MQIGISRRLLTLVLAVGTLLGLTCSGLNFKAYSDPSDPAEPVSSYKAMAHFGSCLASEQTGDVLIMIDQSGSLARTDPDKNRIPAAQYFVDRLAGFTEKTGIHLNVQVAGFSYDYNNVGGWVDLTPSSVDQVKNSINEAGNIITALDTDYWTAVSEGRKTLVDHSADQEHTCRAMAWFTDGEYEIDIRHNSSQLEQYGARKPYAPESDLGTLDGTSAAVELGKKDLCRAGGVTDQVRLSDITMLGIGLTSSEDPNFDFIKTAVLGGGKQAEANGVAQCGEVEEPPGAFFPVTDLDSLLLAFDEISAPGQTSKRFSSQICQGELCPETVSFVLDDSVKQVTVMVNSPVEGLDAYLYSPDRGEPMKLAASSDNSRKTEGSLTYAWLTKNTLEFEIEATQFPDWQGEWRFALVDPNSASAGENSTVSMHFFSPMVLEWHNLRETSLHQKQELKEVDLQALSKIGGDKIALSSLQGKVEINVVLTDADKKQHELFSSSDKNSLKNPVPITIPEAALGEGVIATSLTITTADAETPHGTVPGTKLEPLNSVTPVSINPPLDFPTINGKLNFGTLTEPTATTDLVVNGPGCVWVEPDKAKITGSPFEDAIITLEAANTEQSKCLQIAENDTVKIPVTVKIDKMGNGGLTGNLPVQLSPTDRPQEAQTISVAFQAELVKPLNTTTFTLALILALIAGIGIPIILLYLVKAFTSRIPAGSIATATAVVEVPDNDGLVQIAFTDNQFEVRSLRRSSSLAVGMYNFKTKMGWLPTTTGRVVLQGTAPSISGHDSGNDGGGMKAVLPLNLRDNWVAVLDQPDSPKRVTLILIMSDIDAERRESVLAKARENLARKVHELDARIKTAPDALGNNDGDMNPAGGAMPDGAMPGGPMPGGPMPGGPMPGGATPGGPMPGGATPGGPMPGGPMPGGPMPGGPMPGGATPGGPMPGGPMPGGPMPGGPMPGGPMPGGPMPGSPMPGGPMPGGAMPGGPMPGGPMPGGAMPGGPIPGSPIPGSPIGDSNDDDFPTVIQT